MIESELFALLEETADAAYSVTDRGEICSWNRAAEQLFGYTRAEALGRHIEEVLDAFDTLGTEPLAGGIETAVRKPGKAGNRVPNFDLNVRTQSGKRIWINVSTIVFNNRRTGRRLLVRLARDITPHRHKAMIHDRMVEAARQVVALEDDATGHAPVETLSARERQTLQLFADGNASAAVARTLGISAQTLRNHLHNINRKLRTHTRLEAVTHAQKRGFIK